MKNNKKIYFIGIVILFIGFIIYQRRTQQVILTDIISKDFSADISDIVSIHIIAQDTSPFSSEAQIKKFENQASITDIFQVFEQIELKQAFFPRKNMVVRGISKHFSIEVKSKNDTSSYVIIVFDKVLRTHYKGKEKTFIISNPELLAELLMPFLDDSIID